MFFINLYVDVPKCPRCESPRTGRYIYRPYTPSSMIAGVVNSEKRALKNGMYIRATEIPLGELGYNLFCEDCGAEYWGTYKTRILGYKKLREIIEEKEIEASEFNKYKKRPKAEIKAEKKAERKAKREERKNRIF